MQEQRVYAIIRKGAKKYRHQLRCPLLAGQLPIFWLKAVAKKKLKECGLKDNYEIVRVSLYEN